MCITVSSRHVRAYIYEHRAQRVKSIFSYKKKMLSTYKVYHSSSPMAFAYKYTISVSTLPVVDLEGSMESLS